MDFKAQKQQYNDRMQVLAQTYNTSAEIIEIITELKLIDIKSTEALTTKIKEYINSNDEDFTQEVLKVLWSRYPDKASFVWSGQIIKNSNVQVCANNDDRKFNLGEIVIIINDGYPFKGRITEVKQTYALTAANYDRLSPDRFFYNDFRSEVYYEVTYFDGEITSCKKHGNSIYKTLDEATAAFRRFFEDQNY